MNQPRHCNSLPVPSEQSVEAAEKEHEIMIAKIMCENLLHHGQESPPATAPIPTINQAAQLQYNGYWQPPYVMQQPTAPRNMNGSNIVMPSYSPSLVSSSIASAECSDNESFDYTSSAAKLNTTTTTTNRTTVRRRTKSSYTNDEEIVEVGMRVNIRFDSDDWWGANITSVDRDKYGEVTNVAVVYDNGDEEECVWPDEDVIIQTGNGYPRKRKTMSAEGTTTTTTTTSRSKPRITMEQGSDSKTTKWHWCGEKGCDYKSRVASHVKPHKAYVHNVDVKYNYCGFDNCPYKAKTAGDVKTHKAMIHDIDVTYYLCGENDCEYKAKKSSSVKRHKQNIHDIDVVWHACGVGDCQFRAKMSSSVKQHKTMVHDIDVTWYHCGIGECEFKSKHRRSSNNHRKNAHSV